MAHDYRTISATWFRADQKIIWSYSREPYTMRSPPHPHPAFHCARRIAAFGCGVNNIPTYDESAKAKWLDVQNQYQRRADLIPNLVETVICGAGTRGADAGDRGPRQGKPNQG